MSKLLTITSNLSEVAGRLPNESMARAVMSRAMNRGLTAGRTQAVREAAKDYAVKQGQVRDKSRMQKATPTRLEASLEFSGPALNLADFRVQPNKPQPARRPVLRAMVARRSGFRSFKGVFLVQVRPGRSLAFKRDGKKRLPISQVYGPSIPTLVGAERVRKAVAARAHEVIQGRLDHEINRELAKGKMR